MHLAAQNFAAESADQSAGRIAVDSAVDSADSAHIDAHTARRSPEHIAGHSVAGICSLTGNADPNRHDVVAAAAVVAAAVAAVQGGLCAGSFRGRGR